MKIIRPAPKPSNETRQFMCPCGAIVEACADEGKFAADDAYVVFDCMPCCRKKQLIRATVFYGAKKTWAV